jgi:hypothetical protein
MICWEFESDILTFSERIITNIRNRFLLLESITNSFVSVHHCVASSADVITITP